MFITNNNDKNMLNELIINVREAQIYITNGNHLKQRKNSTTFYHLRFWQSVLKHCYSEYLLELAAQ